MRTATLIATVSFVLIGGVFLLPRPTQAIPLPFGGMVIWNIFPLVECFGSDPNPFLIAPAGFAPPGPYGLIPATVRYLMSVPLHPGSFILGWYDSPPQGICIAGVPPFGFPFFAMPVLTIGSSL